MENADVIRSKLEQAKLAKSYQEAISILADIQYEIGMDACKERRRIREDLSDFKCDLDGLKILLIGNGDPDRSLVNRLDRLNSMGDDVRLIKALLIGDITNGGDRKGLVGRVIDVEKQSQKTSDNQTKIMWLVIIAVIGQILANIFI